MAHFNRLLRVEGSSWALWEFKEYEAQMNNMYWAGEASRGYSTYVVRHAAKHVPVKSTLFASGANSGRFPQDQQGWLSSMADLQIWNRASFVIAAAGAFERYLERAIRTALLSDPALLYGRSRTIEGVSWLKLGIEPPYKDTIKGVTVGTWSERYAALKRLLGDIPMVQHHIGILDEAREFKNSLDMRLVEILVHL